MKKKEDENEELTDTLEILRSWYEEPRELAQRMELRKLDPNKVFNNMFFFLEMKDILLHLNDVISNLNRRPKALPLTPSASPSQSAAKRMVIDGLFCYFYNLF